MSTCLCFTAHSASKKQQSQTRDPFFSSLVITLLQPVVVKLWLAANWGLGSESDGDGTGIFLQASDLNSVLERSHQKHAPSLYTRRKTRKFYTRKIVFGYKLQIQNQNTRAKQFIKNLLYCQPPPELCIEAFHGKFFLHFITGTMPQPALLFFLELVKITTKSDFVITHQICCVIMYVYRSFCSQKTVPYGISRNVERQQRRLSLTHLYLF